MIAKAIFILSLVALTSAIRVQDAHDTETVLIDVDNKPMTPANSVFLSGSKLYCALPGTTTQTGTIWRGYGLLHRFVFRPSSARKTTVTIKFKEAFDEIPKVVVSLIGFDVASKSAGVSVSAEEVTTKSFKLVTRAPAGAKVYGVHASWIATVSAKSSIWVHEHKISTLTSKALADFSAKTGDRSAIVKFKYSRQLTNPGVAVAISGYEFGSGKNMRLSFDTQNHDTKGFQLKASTWSDSIWESASVVVVVFEKTTDRTTAIVSSTQNGKLSTGKGDRYETVTATFPNIYGPLWSGLTQVDFDVDHGYRLKSETTTSKNVASTKFKTWSETQAYIVKEVLLHVAPSNQVVTRTGAQYVEYIGKSHEMEITPSRERTDKIWVKFDSPFFEVPSVGVAFSGFDLYWANPRVNLYAVDVSTTGFYIKVVAPVNSVVYSLQINWIATISSKSGIYIKTLEVDNSDSQLKAFTKADWTEHSAKYTLNFPRAMTKPAVTIGLSGFSFGTTNARIDVQVPTVTSKDFTVQLKTWADTQITKVGVTLIIYEKDCLHGKVEISSGTTAELYNGMYERNKVSTANLSFKGAISWTAVSFMDFVAGRNYRLQQAATIVDQKITVVQKTWWDTQVWLSNSNVFYTYPTR